MSILDSELRWYRSAVSSDLPANGGVMSDAEIVSGVTGNLFPSATVEQRTVGATMYRKMFAKVANASSLPMYSPRIWQDANTDGDDRITFFAGTQRNTQAGLSGSEMLFGTGSLNASVSAGASSITVLVEDGTKILFRSGETLRISDRATPDGAGNEQWIVIASAPTVVGNVVTIALATPLANNYLAPGTKVSSVYMPGTVESSRTTPVVTSVSGSVTLTPDVSDITTHSIGTVEQTWTLTFATSTTFNITGDLLGLVAAGNVSSPTAPNNPAYGVPYFTIDAAVFGGSFLAGDTVVFSTSPCAVPIWVKRVIPAGAGTVSNNKSSFYIDGESD
mgnify:FL=1